MKTMIIMIKWKLWLLWWNENYDWKNHSPSFNQTHHSPDYDYYDEM